MTISELVALIKQTAKSKTINFNVWVPAILAILSELGYTFPPEVMVGLMGAVNVLFEIYYKKRNQ